MSMRSDLLCRNGCGFFGNPEWQWFCSKCWREHLQKGKSPPSHKPPVVYPVHSAVAAVQSVVGGAGDQGKSGLQFHPFGAPGTKPKFSPKRSKSNVETLKHKRQSLDRNLKQMFQKGTRFAASSSKESPEKAKVVSKAAAVKGRVPASSASPEVRAVSAEFAEFLNQKLERSAVSDISRQIKMVIDKIQSVMNSTSTESVEELSTDIQEFYQNFQKRLETKQQFHALNDDDVTKILEYAERYITVACYKLLFSPVITNDEEKDLELQTKIRSLNWISTKELNCTIDESNQEVRNLLFEAINDILEIDGQLSPQDKMNCLVKCSNKVFQMLQASNETPASADDFLPCLIYICLKANPPRVQSNINYITRFCNENKVRMGEAGYFFVNLCCAMSFIENMTAESISMDPEEYESYVSGKSVPPGSWRTSLLMCEGLQQMSANLKCLSDMKDRNEEVLSEATKLQEEISAFQTDVESEVKAVLERTQYSLIRQKKQAINPDEELDFDTRENLPPPLTPQGAESPAKVSKNDPNVGNFLEDYLSLSSACTSDNISMISLETPVAKPRLIDVTSTPSQPENLTRSASAYRGFSAQMSTQITSISCDNSGLNESTPQPSSSTTSDGVFPDAKKPLTEDSFSTPSSSPLVSAATSLSTPDELIEDTPIATASDDSDKT